MGHRSKRRLARGTSEVPFTCKTPASPLPVGPTPVMDELLTRAPQPLDLATGRPLAPRSPRRSRRR